jgi:hypothetical protein
MLEILLSGSVILVVICLSLFILEVVMGGIRRPAEIIYVKVPYREFPHEEGFLELAHGWSEVFVPTEQQPTHVWLSLDDFEGVQCCLGQVNMLSTYSTTDGFVVLANITSESAYVKWIAEFA